MDFLVRIFFIGLIAFVPSRDGKELTVLLLNSDQGYAVSDGTWIEPHKPLLFVRAGKCEGDCGAEPAIARFVFPQAGAEQARDSLSQALHEGASWLLDGSHLSIQQENPGRQAASRPLQIHREMRRVEAGHPSDLPQTPGERKDFSWVAELGRIDAAAGMVDPDVLSPQPRKGLIAARLRLHSGEVWTYRLVGVEDKVLPLDFRPLRQSGEKTDYSQALADWVVAELRVPGDSVRIVETRFSGAQGRAVKLSPENGVIELAVMNVPPSQFDQRSMPGADHHSHGPGKHFEMYYELAQARPPNHLRPVPHVTTATGAPWSALHLQGEPGERTSALLRALGLDDPRGPYNWLICPLGQLSDGGTVESAAEETPRGKTRAQE